MVPIAMAHTKYWCLRSSSYTGRIPQHRSRASDSDFSAALMAYAAASISFQATPPVSIRKAIACSLVEAVRDMHAEGIVHGDLHHGNDVGLSLPALTEGRDEEYIRVSPEVSTVLPVDPAVS